MQCVICVTYMLIICGASPPGTREIATTHEKRSLFRDVIEFLRTRAQLPEDFGQHDDNNLELNYNGYDNEPSYLPSDGDFIPRRNDRMPPVKYRFSKSIDINEGDDIGTSKPQHEFILYIDDGAKITQKPKKDIRPKPNENKTPNKNKENEDNAETEAQTDNNVPFTNNMAGQSQIGNRESQTVIKPTVIVNLRGSVNHKDSEIILNRKRDNNTRFFTPLNVFNINQDILVQRDESMKKGLRSEIQHEVKSIADTHPKVEDDMVVLETATWQPENNDDNHKGYNVLQILLSI